EPAVHDGACRGGRVRRRVQAEDRLPVPLPKFGSHGVHQTARKELRDGSTSAKLVLGNSDPRSSTSARTRVSRRRGRGDFEKRLPRRFNDRRQIPTRRMWSARSTARNKKRPYGNRGRCYRTA